MTSPYITEAAERAKTSKAPAEVIQLSDHREPNLREQLNQSLEIETLERLNRENTAFARMLMAKNSPRLAVFHRHFIELGNEIFARLVKP